LPEWRWFTTPIVEWNLSDEIMEGTVSRASSQPPLILTIWRNITEERFVPWSENIFVSNKSPSRKHYWGCKKRIKNHALVPSHIPVWGYLLMWKRKINRKLEAAVIGEANVRFCVNVVQWRQMASSVTTIRLVIIMIFT
jgi:hypothetical protein